MGRFDSNRYVLSFFSGGMGLDLGLTQAGLSVVMGQDFDKACVATMRQNGCAVMPGDIRLIQPEDVLSATGLQVGEPFLICGGPPCQPFSTAGKRLGINDPRGSLFMDFIRMIDFIRPRFFVMENVKGLISAKLKSSDGRQGLVLDVILDEFRKLGYGFVYGLLDAVNYGTPQFRERFVLMGTRDGEDIFLPMPMYFQMHQCAQYRWRTVGDAILDLEQNCGPCAAFSKQRAAYLHFVPEGGNWRDLPPDKIQAAMGGAYQSGGGKVGFYRRLSYHQPSPTVTTSPAQKATMLCHPKQDRPLSVKECARLQEFPDDWIFAGTMAEQYRQIGNAVPVGLGRAIGQVFLSVADGTAVIETKRLRGTDVHEKLKRAMALGQCERSVKE